MSQRRIKIDESFLVRPPDVPLRHAAGGVVICERGEELMLALVSEGDHSFILPKGGIEPNESFFAAAVREVEEEAGLVDLQNLGWLATTERLNLERTRWVRTEYYLFVSPDRQGKPTDTSRLYEQHWFSLHNLPTLFWPDQAALIHNKTEEISSRVRAHQSRSSS